VALLDAWASSPHYLEHLAPIWRAVAPSRRGSLFVTPPLGELAVELELEAVVRTGRPPAPPRSRTPTLVAGWKDAERAHDYAGRPTILLEHGAGQSYANSSSPGYVGGAKRRRGVIAALLPSERAAAVHRNANPSIPAYVVGSPKLDVLPARAPRGARPRVAVSFHWDAAIAPETRWAFAHYTRALRKLAKVDDLELLGHGHPLAWRELARFYAAAGIRRVPRFADVLAEADVYVVDNSSTLYEAAFAGIPVVVLNAPHYRRDVEHGLRFWEAADVGPQVDNGDELEAAVRLALEDPPAIAARRRAIVETVYAHPGRATRAAVAAIRTVLEE
jgi:hypothetical protein